MKTADLSSPEEVALFTAIQQDVQAAGIAFKTGFRALSLTLAEPSLDDTMPDDERLTWAIQEAAGVEQIDVPHHVMVKLAETLRQHSFQVCIKGLLTENRFSVLDITGPQDTGLYAAAIDIGTTTVSAVLAEMTTGKIVAKGSSGNGQIRYGADVINRIIEQGKPGGRKKLQNAIVKETLVPILVNLCKAAGISAQSILQLCVAANTTMNHLFVGVDASPVRMEPYIPSFFSWNGLKAGDLKLPANPLAPVLIAPNIGSYVGGDITAGVFASLIWNKPEFSLFIDLGTNGEIAFGNQDFLVSCACSAGPAFEGGDISCGMRATDGAIEACVIDKDTMDPTFHIVGGGWAEACRPVRLWHHRHHFRALPLRYHQRQGPVRPGWSPGGRDRHGMGRYILAYAHESATEREIALNEVDIDNFIRAKGAIFSAIETLLNSVDMTVDMIDTVYVAGGIGSGINMKNAVNIGMFPDVPLEKFQYIGNSSLTGAYAMVLSDQAAEKVDEVAKNMTYMELSTHPGYMDSFVAACFLPHTNRQLFPHSIQEI